MSKVTVSVDGLSLVHRNSGGVSTATLPDVCIGPAGAVPYSNVARSRDLARGTTSVFADGGHSIAIQSSSFGKSTGDEGGISGGVISKTVAAEATFLSHSFDVRIEGEGAARLTDKMLHNRGNTIDCAGVVQALAGARIVDRAPRPKHHAKDKDAKIKKSDRVWRRGIDTNGSTLDTNYTKARGFDFVGRYLSFDGSHPVITPEENARLKAGGLDVFAIWERTKYRTIEANTVADAWGFGVQDATEAQAQLVALGVPERPIYFTVDFAVTSKNWNWKIRDTGLRQKQLIVGYFAAVNYVIGKKRTGVYGTYWTLKKLFDKEMVAYGWQWTFDDWGEKIHPQAQLRQYNIKATQYPEWGVGGAGALDLDHAVAADFGQW